MNRPVSRCMRWARLCPFLIVLCLAPVAMAFTSPDDDAEFRDKIRLRIGGLIGQEAVPVSSLEDGDRLKQGWTEFTAGQNGGWKVWVDSRSGLPKLAVGKGIAWIAGRGNDLEEGGEVGVEQLAALARGFMREHSGVMGEWIGGRLVLDTEASGARGDRVWQISFAQEVDGVRVEGARYDFQIVHGNLVSFGASNWGRVRISATPELSAEEARGALDAYLGTTGRADLPDLGAAELRLVPVDPARAGGAPWDGARGEGYDHRLIWRFRFTDATEIPTWTGEVDAHTGEIVAFYDDTRYERIKGHVNPVTDDGDCPTGGCPEPGYPLPYTDYSEAGGPPQQSNQFGLYECTSPGATIETTLDGPYVWINDQCGTVSATTTCDAELDMGASAGINCNVAPGAAPGNTDAARSCYYSVSNVNRKARFWIPGNSWLNTPLQCRSNVNSTCNATYNGNLNMYRAGNGCGNTGQNNAVVVHEWGHGMDANDGGGYDDPSEAYADVVAIFESRASCVGRGFFTDGSTCSGYGDTCLTCTGIRDLDWDARQAHTPATPTGFEDVYCPGGGSPCGSETHCASYVPAESIYDLAARDLPAMGLDADTAWQLAERLWYASRAGSGGDVFNCSLPNSDSCGTDTWYHQLRLQDDDDGNLNNGTPHAGAIFAAFDRHDIACGNAGDAENQSSSSCPPIGAPVVTTKAFTNTVELSWNAVTDADGYRIYRNENGCNWSQMPIAEVDAATTTYRDEGLANDFNVYYRVVAFGTNTACEGPVSSCVSAAAQPLAGVIKFDQLTYGCNNLMTLTVKDANHSTSSMTVTLWSDSESTPESVLLSETAPDSAKYIGTIMTTANPAAPDGVLSITDGDTITAEYIDEDDGEGNLNVSRLSAAAGDCVFPVITGVGEQNVTGSSATVSWTTNEISDSVLNWGPTLPPANIESEAAQVTGHSLDLTGLAECTVYYYQVESTDPAGNTATDDSGGSYYRFETLGDFGQGLQPCHAGQVSVLDGNYSCNDTASFRLIDIDLNTDSFVSETVAILVTSSTETAGESVILTETGPNTSIFTGTIPTVSGEPGADGLLQTSEGDLLTATYFDEDDGAGVPAISFDTAVLDCVGPQIEDLRLDRITHARASFLWSTTEPANSVIEWGFTPALGEVLSVSSLVTSRDLLVSKFGICSDVYFRVTSTDAYGNVMVSDNGGEPFVFRTWDIPGLYVLEDFENGAAGWTLNGEWEIGPPQGLGGSSGPADPTDAYNNDNVLGHDLSGLGSFQGDYEPNTSEMAKTPSYDATDWVNTKVIFHRRLNVAAGDAASAWFFSGPIGAPFYNNNGEQVTETSFQAYDFNLGPQVDGSPAVRLEFTQSSNDSVQRSGWNIDDLIFKDGSLPDYAPCGGCATAPAFAGAISALDNDACGADGVTVYWNPAPAWGSGVGGTYSVYRDSSPGFLPSGANRIAAGVAGTTYNDLTAPTDQDSYYLVRAENDESCSTGPNNGGLTDDNEVYVLAGETTSQPTPSEVTTLSVDPVAETHVRLSWQTVPAATAYRIYRSTSPVTGFALLAETTTTLFEDVGEMTNGNSYYYKVMGVNSCGVEGP